MKWLSYDSPCISLELSQKAKSSQITQAKTRNAVLEGSFEGVLGFAHGCVNFFFYKVWVWKGKILWGRGKGKQPPESSAMALCIPAESSSLLQITYLTTETLPQFASHLSPALRSQGLKQLKAFYEFLYPTVAHREPQSTTEKGPNWRRETQLRPKPRLSESPFSEEAWERIFYIPSWQAAFPTSLLLDSTFLGPLVL